MKWKRFFEWYMDNYMNMIIPLIGWGMLLGTVILSPVIGIDLNAKMTPMAWVLLLSWVFYMIGIPLLLELIELIKRKRQRQ